MKALASRPDPFPLSEGAGPGTPGFRDTRAKTQVTSVISAPSTTKTIITGGQSNAATGCGSVTYTTISSQAQNLNIYDGGIYAGADPVLGCSYGPFVNPGPSSINMRIADSMISRGKATRCIVVPIAQGGTLFEQWAPNAAGSMFNRISTAILRCRARVLEPDAFFWLEGEANNTSGSSAATVTQAIRDIVDGIRAMSCSAPFYVGYYSMNAGVISANVRAGIANSIEVPRNILAGYDADTNLTVAGGFRNADLTHTSDSGLALSATGWTTIAFP